jgi:endonuclease YncB( thermonuclease family)
VDTPENDRPFYHQAVALAESLLMGKQIEYETDAVERDRYGRYLWYVFADSIFVNDRIINRGMGRVYLFQSNIKYAGRFIQSQKNAREAKSGIWSLPVPPPEEYYIALKGSYRFHRPLCMSIKGANPEKIIEYRSRDSLLDLGISPCRNCRP